MSSSDASHILHPVRLLLESAPAADAADTSVEKWGKLVVQFLNGLKARRPEFLSLPEVVSVIDLLHDIVDVRRRVVWLAWGGDWLPGTVIEQCISQLPAAATKYSAPPAPPPPVILIPSAFPVSPAPTQTTSSYQVPTSSRVTAAKAAMPPHISRTCGVKRVAPNEASSSCTHSPKRAHITTSISSSKSTKGRSLKEQLEMCLLRDPRKVLHKCRFCESGRFSEKHCLTVIKKGVIQNRCAQCIISHTTCEWKKGHLKVNHAYREESSSFYDLAAAVGPSEGAASATTSVTRTPFVIDIPDRPVAAIRPPYGPKSAVRRRPTRASLSLSDASSLPTSHHFTPPVSPVAPTLLSPPVRSTGILLSEITDAGNAQPDND